jgi:hypothetical protein
MYYNAISDSHGSQNDTLRLDEVNDIIDNLKNITLLINTNSSFIMVLPPNQSDNVIVLGAFLGHETGFQVIGTFNKDSVINSNLLAAAIINPENLIDITSLNMMIISKPFGYTNMIHSNEKTIVSPIIIAAIQRASTTSTPIDISLYFKVLDEYAPYTDGKYFCSFLDTNTLKWSESGCTEPHYNAGFSRYECSCNHLSTFALVWLPDTLQSKYLTSQDIASLVFLSIPIICFIGVIIHSFTIQLLNPMTSTNIRDLLPLISSASTTILFIFYLALTMTVYTRTTSVNESQCFLSSNILMFITYFFFIFMLCVKTSIAYFNYLRFIHLFPQPSHRKLLILLIISFFISIGWVLVAVGSNYINSFFDTIRLYPYKLCWFTRNVIYYFMTLPLSIFLLLNFITIVFIVNYMIHYERHAEKSPELYQQMKLCVFVLLSSCITQGFGWLFGSFFLFINPTIADVLGWIFIVLNGLEGMWTIMLYIIIQFQRADKQKHPHTYEEITTATAPLSKRIRL